MLRAHLQNFHGYIEYHQKLSKKHNPQHQIVTPDHRTFLMWLVMLWTHHYSSLATAITGGITVKPPYYDMPAKQILMGRNREHNRRYPLHSDFSKEQVTVSAIAFKNTCLDVDSIFDLPGCGPSVMSLWTEARNRGLAPSEASAALETWATHFNKDLVIPDGNARPDESIIRQKDRRLTWRLTGDAMRPWDTEVDGKLWQVRLNDYPEEPMYGLLIDGAKIDDFHEWPQNTWDRGEPGQENPAAHKRITTIPGARIAKPGRLLDRYKNGDCEAVWRELVSLGPDVTESAYRQAAEQVAAETMNRARHNVEQIVQRLKAMRYKFLEGRIDGMSPCRAKDLERISSGELKGLKIPVALNAFFRDVGDVSLVGCHRRLSPNPDVIEVCPDPLEAVAVLWGFGFDEWLAAEVEDREPYVWEIGADAQGKMDMLEKAEPSGFYGVELPNPAADAVLLGEAGERTFVEHLRWSFRWGGFPGWEKENRRPEKELAILREGLLPL